MKLFLIRIVLIFTVLIPGILLMDYIFEKMSPWTHPLIKKGTYLVSEPLGDWIYGSPSDSNTSSKDITAKKSIPKEITTPKPSGVGATGELSPFEYFAVFIFVLGVVALFFYPHPILLFALITLCIFGLLFT